MSDDKIAKLPKWAQDMFRDLQREREVAIRALNEWTDNQTPSPVFIDELECLGEEKTERGSPPSRKRRYVQTHRIQIEWAGVVLDVHLRDEGIALQWGTLDRSMAEVSMVPRSYQQVTLMTKDKMR
jgi:hypothetical protein